MNPSIGRSTALLTDQYELTMLQSAIDSGAAHRRSVFELFSRLGIRPIVARTERALVNIADGYSRTSAGQRIGVVAVRET